MGELTEFKSGLWIEQGFPGGTWVKNPLANAGDAGNTGSIPGLGRSPGGGNGSSPSILAWKIPWSTEPGRWATIHGVTKSRTQLNDWAHCRLNHSTVLGLNVLIVITRLWLHKRISFILGNIDWRASYLYLNFRWLKTHINRDFFRGQVVKNPPCNVGDGGLIPAQRTKIPHTKGQLLSPHSAIKNPTY